LIWWWLSTRPSLKIGISEKIQMVDFFTYIELLWYLWYHMLHQKLFLYIQPHLISCIPQRYYSLHISYFKFTSSYTLCQIFFKFWENGNKMMWYNEYQIAKDWISPEKFWNCKGIKQVSKRKTCELQPEWIPALGKD
jgi:hypothetical protein